MKKWARYLLFPAAALAAGALSGWLTREAMQTSYETVKKSPLMPPGFVFPIAWTILYVLMGIGMALVWGEEGERRKQALALWIAQLAMNFTWSLIFFNAQNYLFALVWLVVLWLLILAMTLVFYRSRPVAGLLQIPYLIWVAFAGYLNYAIWQLNP